MSFPFETLPHYWINRLSFMLRRELSQKFRAAGHDIGGEEWAVLMLLWRCNGQTPSALAEATIRDRTTITRFVDGLVKKGLVERRIDAEDRRRSLIFLTDQGHALKGELEPIAEQLVQDTLTSVTPDECALVVGVLKRMNENVLNIVKS